MFGYKCINVVRENGHFEVFEPALRKIKFNEPSLKESFKMDKSQTEFSSFEDSSVDEDEIRDNPVRLMNRRDSLETKFISAKLVAARLVKGQSEEKALGYRDIENEIAPRFGKGKQAQTVYNELETTKFGIKNFVFPDWSSKSNLSNFDTSRSPTIKLSQDRWVRKAALRRESIISSLKDKEQPNVEEGLVRSPIENKKAIEDIRSKLINDKKISLKVWKNLKYVLRLRRSPLLK